MTNKEIYKKTLGFSLRRLLFDCLSFVVLGLLGFLGFMIAEKTMNSGLIGLLIGIMVGIVVVILVTRYVAYALSAGQIAMITRGISDGTLPDNPVKEGIQIVKERFITVAAYFAVTRLIKSIFSQLSRLLYSVGGAIGGSTGRSISGIISAVVQVVIDYLSLCCLGWVFLKKDEDSMKATCEGAVIFFKKGKTLARNMGRVFGFGLLSFLAIGGVLTGVFYLVANLFRGAFDAIAREVVELAAKGELDLPQIFSYPSFLMLVAAIITAVVFWSFIHTTFVRPFILVGVLRDYIQAGLEEAPTEADFEMLDGKSKAFAKAHQLLT